MILKAHESDKHAIIQALLVSAEEDVRPFCTPHELAMTAVAEKFAEAQRKIPPALTQLREQIVSIASGVFDEVLKLFFGQPHQNALFIYKEGDRVKGMVGFFSYDEQTRQHHCGRIVRFWVEQSARSQGVGGALLNALMDYITDLGFIEKISVDVLTFNSERQVVDLFERRGFDVAGIQKGLVKFDDGYGDLVLMEKLFRSADSDSASGLDCW